MAEAKTKIVIDVGEGAKSLRTLKQEFKDGQKELEGLTVGTKEYVAQIKKLANVKDEIEDLNKEINAFRPDQKMASFVGAARGIASGFEAATAASALFGSEAEDVEKALLKVQSAMALANAVQEVGELGKAFQLLGTTIKAAIGSSGIGALLLALGAVVAYWDKIKAAVTGVTDEMKEEAAMAKQISQERKNTFNHIERTENILKLQGNSELQILEIKKAAMQKQIEADTILLKTQIRNQKIQEESAKRNQEILAGILKWVGGPINLILLAIDKISGFVGEATHLADDFSKWTASFLFDPEKISEEGNKANQELLKQLEEEKNSLAGFNLQIQQINKDASEKRKAQAEKDLEDLKAVQKKHREGLFEIQQEQQSDDDAAMQKWLTQKNTEVQIMMEAEQAKTRTAELEAQRRKEIREAELAVATSVVNSFGSLAQIFGQQGEAMQDFQKGLAVTQIAIDTAKAISGAVAQAQSVPFPGNIVAIATGVATVLANIARAKQILQSAGGGPSLNIPTAGGGSNVRPPQINGVSNTSTVLDNLNQGGNKSQAPLKAYVVETDITQSQKTIQRIEKKSKY